MGLQLKRHLWPRLGVPVVQAWHVPGGPCATGWGGGASVWDAESSASLHSCFGHLVGAYLKCLQPPVSLRWLYPQSARFLGRSKRFGGCVLCRFWMDIGGDTSESFALLLACLSEKGRSNSPLERRRRGVISGDSIFAQVSPVECIFVPPPV